MAWNTSFLSLTVTSYGTSSWGAGSPPKVMSPSSGRLKRRIFFRSSPKFSLRSTGTALTSTCWHKSAYFGTEFNQMTQVWHTWGQNSIMFPWQMGQLNSGQTISCKVVSEFWDKTGAHAWCFTFRCKMQNVNALSSYLFLSCVLFYTQMNCNLCKTTIHFKTKTEQTKKGFTHSMDKSVCMCACVC